MAQAGAGTLAKAGARADALGKRRAVRGNEGARVAVGVVIREGAQRDAGEANEG